MPNQFDTSGDSPIPVGLGGPGPITVVYPGITPGTGGRAGGTGIPLAPRGPVEKPSKPVDLTEAEFRNYEGMAPRAQFEFLVARQALPSDAVFIPRDNGTWGYKKKADVEAEERFERENVRLDNGEFVPRETFEKLGQDQKTYLKTKGVEQFNKIQGRVTPTTGGYVSGEEFVKDYFKARGWKYEGTSPKTASVEETTIYLNHLDEALGKYEAKYAPKVSIEEYAQRYFAERDWYFDANRLMDNPKVLAVYDERLREATDNYRKQYGNKAYIESAVGKVGEMILPIGRAIRPEVGLQDITAQEWALSAAEVALWVAGPSGKAIENAGHATLGRFLSHAIPIAAGATMTTVAATDDKMPALSRIIYGTVGVGTMLYHENALRNMAAKSVPMTPAQELAATRRDNLAMTDSVRKAYGGDAAEAYTDYLDNRTSYLWETEHSLDLKDKLSAAQYDLRSWQSTYTNSYRNILNTPDGDDLDSLIRMRDFAKDRVTQIRGQIAEINGGLAMSKTNLQATRRSLDRTADVLQTVVKDKLAVNEFEKVSKALQNIKEFPDMVDTMAKNRPTYNEVKTFDQMAQARADVRRVNDMIASAGTPRTEADVKRLADLNKDLDLAESRARVFERQLDNQMKGMKGFEINPEDFGTPGQGIYKQGGPAVLTAAPPGTGTSSQTIHELNKPASAFMDQVVDAIGATVSSRYGVVPSRQGGTRVIEVAPIKDAFSHPIVTNNPDIQKEIEPIVTEITKAAQEHFNDLRNEGMTKTEATKKTKQMIAEAVNTQIGPIIEPGGGLAPAVQPATQTATKTKVATKTKTVTEHVQGVETRPFIPAPPGESEPQEEKKKLKYTPIQGAVAWRMGRLKKGPVINIIKRPYKTQEDLKTTVGQVPEGAVLATGKGSAKKSATLLQGEGPKEVTIDSGFQDLTITSQGKKVNLDFTPDPLGLTHHEIHVGNPKPRLPTPPAQKPPRRGASDSRKVGKQYFTPIGGHRVAVSRRPLKRHGKR